MHRCSASMTTMTPRGSSLRISASAICAVSRSCTCGRLAYRSTSRAIFDKPGDPAVLAGDVADVGHTVERHQVVLAGGVQRDLFDQHQLVVLLVKGGVQHGVRDRCRARRTSPGKRGRRGPGCPPTRAGPGLRRSRSATRGPPPRRAAGRRPGRVNVSRIEDAAAPSQSLRSFQPCVGGLGRLGSCRPVRVGGLALPPVRVRRAADTADTAGRADPVLRAGGGQCGGGCVGGGGGYQ